MQCTLAKKQQHTTSLVSMSSPLGAYVLCVCVCVCVCVCYVHVLNNENDDSLMSEGFNRAVYT